MICMLSLMFSLWSTKNYCVTTEMELFYSFRNHNIHTVLMWDSAAIAVKNDFFCLM